jgi:segregation and condensation protein B
MEAIALETQSVKTIVESLLFVANGPVHAERLQRALDVSRDDIEEALRALDLEGSQRGVRLQRKGDEVQLVTSPDAAPYVERLLGLPLAGKLSAAALEALAVVAYRQPVTRAQVEAVRGVNSDGVLNTLASRALITEIGRLEAAGRPILYGTTFEFLQFFGLKDLRQLPPLK